MAATLKFLADRLSKELPILREKYGVESLSLFGSYVRGEERPDSDVDILVTFHDTPGLLRFIDLENHLAELLEKKVDLVSKNALKPAIGRRVLAEAVAI